MEDPDRIFGQGGAMEALLEAKKAGKIRYIGFTGHKDPLVHLRMLEMAAAQLPFRRGADAAQRHGRPLPQLRAEVLPDARAGRDRRAGHEATGRSSHPEEQGGDADRVPALCA